MPAELISALLVQYYLYKTLVSERIVSCLEFMAHQVAGVTILAMLLSLATISAFSFIGEVKGLLRHDVGFLALEIFAPSIAIAIIGGAGLVLVRSTMSTANLIKFPPHRLKKAVGRLSV